MNKISYFANEINMITNTKIKLFTKFCIESAPDYIFVDCPSSSSGKYHPQDELGKNGTIKHIKKVFNKAQELIEFLDCEEYRDQILSACIIHDLRKQGLKKSGHTVKEHPDLAAKLVEEIHNNHRNLLNKTTFIAIRNACGYHYGQWSIGKWIKNMSDYTDTELVVHLADYISSRRIPEIKPIAAWLADIGL